MGAKEFIDYLIANGFNVFPSPNYMPEDVQENMLPALYVFGTGGFASDDYLPIENPTFQIIVKGKSYSSDPLHINKAEALAKSIIKLFDKKHNYDTSVPLILGMDYRLGMGHSLGDSVGSTYIYLSRAMQSNPIPLGMDTKGRPMYSVNLRFKTREG